MKQLLIVEDNVNMRKILYDWLAGNFPDLTIYVATYGEDALAFIRKNKVDIVLMDIGLPGINGIDATREIKIINPACRVVITSIHDTQASVEKSREAGAVAFVPKHKIYRDLIPIMDHLIATNGDASEQS